jgi:uncharacterized OsmC-like protein
MSRLDRTALQNSVKPGTVVVASTGAGPFDQIMLDGRHMVRADEPASAGGADGGPNPYELLLMSLGSCTSMTVQMYAARKKWPLEQVVVRLRQERVHLQDCSDCEKPDAMVHRIEKTIELIGALDEEQHKRLREVADHCPVHKTLSSKIVIETVLG